MGTISQVETHQPLCKARIILCNGVCYSLGSSRTDDEEETYSNFQQDKISTVLNMNSWAPEQAGREDDRDISSKVRCQILVILFGNNLITPLWCAEMDWSPI